MKRNSVSFYVTLVTDSFNILIVAASSITAKEFVSNENTHHIEVREAYERNRFIQIFLVRVKVSRQ
jgi:hypothetical protein